MIRERNARTDDAEIFRLIQSELIPFSHTVHSSDPQTIRDLPKRFRRGMTYVAAPGKSSTPFGFVHFEAMQAVLYVDMLVIHPQHRNRNWAKKLMGSCEAYGIAHQCLAARLFVDESNPKAHNLYTRLGYATINYYPELRCYEMVKSLSPQRTP